LEKKSAAAAPAGEEATIRSANRSAK